MEEMYAYNMELRIQLLLTNVSNLGVVSIDKLVPVVDKPQIKRLDDGGLASLLGVPQKGPVSRLPSNVKLTAPKRPGQWDAWKYLLDNVHNILLKIGEDAVEATGKQLYDLLMEVLATHRHKDGVVTDGDRLSHLIDRHHNDATKRSLYDVLGKMVLDVADVRPHGECKIELKVIDPAKVNVAKKPKAVKSNSDKEKGTTSSFAPAGTGPAR